MTTSLFSDPPRIFVDFSTIVTKSNGSDACCVMIESFPHLIYDANLFLARRLIMGNRKQDEGKGTVIGKGVGKQCLNFDTILT